MVKLLHLFSAKSAIAAVGDDASALLQMFASAQHSRGERIIAAVAEGVEDSICVAAVAGDVAPMMGSFMAKMSQHAVTVAAGSVAEEDGSFCVPKQDLLLLQRTFGLATAGDLEVAVGKKRKENERETPNADNFETFDFAGDLEKKVAVKQCPDGKQSLIQTMDATVTDKSMKRKASTNLDADQGRVCACRKFMKKSVELLGGVLKQQEVLGAVEAEAVSDGADAGSVKRVEEEVKAEVNTGEISDMFAMVCTQAERLNNWSGVAKLINNPVELVPLYQAADIEGWEHCDKSWVVQGACDEVVSAAPVKVLPLGDSITFGCGDGVDGDDECITTRPADQAGWRAPLWRKLSPDSATSPEWDFVGAKQNGPDDIDKDHEGNPGWKIEDIEGIKDQYLPLKPDVILLHIGTNNFGVGSQEAPEALDRLKSLLETIFGGLPNVRLLLSTLIGVGPSPLAGYDGEHNLEYNEGVRHFVTQYALTGRNIELVDMARECAIGEIGCKSEYCNTQYNIHPNSKGYALMADVWYKHLVGQAFTSATLS